MRLPFLHSITSKISGKKSDMRNFTEKTTAMLLGVAIGDALGVPVEFESREFLQNNPVKTMTGYGSHNQPPGTFSDDTSLTLCLAESLTSGFDLDDIAYKFTQWYDNSYWTARGNVFDIGLTTREAITRLKNGRQPELAGGMGETSNGNGSLMRIAPMVVFLLDKSVEVRYDLVKKVSSITHAHIRSVVSCFYYIEFCRYLLLGKDKFETYRILQKEVTSFLIDTNIIPEEISLFDRLLKNDIATYSQDEIYSSGYVIHTLEASIWCILTTDSFEVAVLKSVNLGEDTDTVGAVTGGLAGILYGLDSIPKDLIKKLARSNDIIELAENLSRKYNVH